ncbi:MAG: hypothetical protein Q9160_002744 [Pyrenula sp. 1 TL-2023]
MSSPAPKPSIDRQNTTPFHLKLFYRPSGFHTLSDFPVPTTSDPSPPLPQHLQIYTWYSCSLSELSHLLTSALPDLLPNPTVGTRLSFRLVYPDTRPPLPSMPPDTKGRYTSKEMGSVVVAPSVENGNDNSGSVPLNLRGEDLDKTLHDARFVIGDFIDCAIFPPLSDGAVVPLPRSQAYPGGSRTGPPPPRENGYTRGRGGHGGGRGAHGASGYGRDFGGNIPSGEWRRGERLPDTSHGGGRGGFDGRRDRGRNPY